MRINAITSSAKMLSHAHSATKKNQNFTGLWGQERREEHDDTYYSHAFETDMGSYYLVTTKEYHPFKNESQKEIEANVKSNSYVDSKNARDYTPVSSYVEQKVQVMKELPFTEAEYEDYKARKLLSANELKFEDTLKTLGLYNALNVKPR